MTVSAAGIGLKILPALLLALHAALLACGAWHHSPTFNEPGHLAAGISVWQFGRFDVYCVNPPLVRTVAAAPMLIAQPTLDWKHYVEGVGIRSEFLLADDFVRANPERLRWLFVLARWACIPFSLLGGYICYRWARELYGETAGLLSLALWCFCPNLLGHAQLITPDVGATAFSLAACYSFWRWLKQPTWARALISGVVLGLAELTKMTLIVLVPLWPLMWLVYRWSDRLAPDGRGWFRQLKMLAAGMVLALYVLNLGYGFEGSFTRLADFKFVSASLGAKPGDEKVPAGGGNRFADTWLGHLPVPVPKQYLVGMDLQRRDFDRYGHPSYLAGRFQTNGWWYYYLYALAIKVPLGTWLLMILALGIRLWRGPVPAPDAAHVSSTDPGRLGSGEQATWRDEFVLLCPAAAVLTLVSSQTGFSEHMRYVLPVFPFVFIWIGRIGPLLGRHHRMLTGIASTALVWSIASSLAVYPHSLSYFNELVGGPMGGPNHLIHSNVDWGQDLYFLKDWIQEHPEATPLKLAYFGTCDPQYFGIDYQAPDPPAAGAQGGGEATIAPGWYAISVNFVRGLPYFSYKGDGTKTAYCQNALAAFQKLTPVATAGYSIYIYHVEE